MIDRTEREDHARVFSSLRRLGWTLLIAPAALLWRAYIATILWQWFLVETYGAQAMPMAVMVGIMVMLTVIRGKSLGVKEAPGNTPHGALAMFVFHSVGPAICLLVGWIARHYVTVAA